MSARTNAVAFLFPAQFHCVETCAETFNPHLPTIKNRGKTAVQICKGYNGVFIYAASLFQQPLQ